ncbi:MAG TPA: transketolase [bacterium]|nr:transketolase [bacterium]
MSKPFDQADQNAVTTMRMLAVDATAKANSGHPGMPIGMAPAAHVLFSRHLKHNPANPHWADRDRFILSAGHGSMLIYSLLHLFGYNLSLEDLKNFRQWGSKTPGHPEFGHTEGVETTTGPLGQGIATAVGFAMAERILAARFNEPGAELINHKTWVIASDGDLMEGVSHESCSTAGHLKLANLKVIYDDNHISIEGDTKLAYTEDVLKRFGSYGWHTLRVTDANDLEALDKALAEAAAETTRPSIIAVRSHIGYGTPLQDNAKVHGSPLSAENIAKTKEFYKWPQEPTFHIPEDAKKRCLEAVEKGKKLEAEWNAKKDAYAKAHPDKFKLFEQSLKKELPADLEKKLPVFPADEKGLATRSASGKVINAIAKEVPFFYGGSADLAGSNDTLIEGGGDFEADHYAGRVFHFGVREHGMGAELNGMALHGGVLPFGATFLMFNDYMKPAYRLAHLMGVQSIFVYTHDSIGQGEDGPTHQPVETLAAMRSIPNGCVIRPADANESAYAWLAALQRKNAPTGLVFTRQNVPTFDRSKMGAASGTLKGAYILSEAKGGKPQVILMGTGSEVQLCVKAQELLEKDGVAARVVSFPSWELFAAQSPAYREEVLPASVKARVAVEAATCFGWHRWTGDCGKFVTLERFGASAPGGVLFKNLGFTPEKVAEAAKASLAEALTPVR